MKYAIRDNNKEYISDIGFWGENYVDSHYDEVSHIEYAEVFTLAESRFWVRSLSRNTNLAKYRKPLHIKVYDI